MKNILHFFLLALSLLHLGAQTSPNPILGSWRGPLLLPNNQKLPLVIHVSENENGLLTAKLDSPAQKGFGLPISKITFVKNKLNFSAQQLRADYEGTFDPATGKITGTFTQNGGDFSLTLGRVQPKSNTSPSTSTSSPAETYTSRPQIPVAPFPYNATDLTFPNPTANLTLAGTLTTPNGPGPFPAVILITGSGPQDRDETLFGHKLFLVIADHLTRQGYAVLRYDDRGVGQSTGTFTTATIHDFATDARAAFNFLKTHPAIDPARITLCGHSEGGLVAPLVAAQEPTVAALILLAGPGLPMREILPQQKRATTLAAGQALSPKFDQILALDQTIYDLLINEGDTPAAREKARAAYRAIDPALAATPAGQKEENQIITAYFRPWIIASLRLDPAAALTQTHCPVLALNGEKDTQVAAAPNLTAIRTRLEKSGNTRVTTQAMPGLNHAFQTCTTGAVQEYAKIEETFSPTALAAITDWLRLTVPTARTP